MNRYTHGDPAHPGDRTATVDPLGKTWTYAYDTAGNLTAQARPTGAVVGTSSFDAYGVLTDASVVLLARERKGIVVTSNRSDLRAIDPRLDVVEC